MRRQKILIVDDDLSVTNLVAAVLGDLQCNFLKAYNASMARKILKVNGDVDLIITDTNMPSETGIELMAKLRAQGLQVPIIVLFSGCYTDPTITPKKVTALGADAVLSKDEIPDKLKPTCRALLKR